VTGVTDGRAPNVDDVSLEGCLAQGRPAPAAVAVRVVVDLARVLAADPSRTAHALSPRDVHIRADGSIDAAPSRRTHPAYLAPEQVDGETPDARAHVFVLGIFLWELLAGRPLFARADASASSLAVRHDPVPDVRTVTSAAPALVAEVLATALARDRHERFQTVEAFARALSNAATAAALASAAPSDVAAWATGRAADTSALLASVPDLDVPRARPSSAARAPTAPPPQSIPRAAVAAPPALASADLDDLDMQIERNLTGASLATATSSRAPASARPRSVASTGLDVAHVRPSASRSQRPADDAEPTTLGRLVASIVAAALAGGSAFGLFQALHRPGGRSVTAALPHAFDGSSATESGVVSLVTLAAAVALGFIGLRARPRSWGLALSGAVMLLLALAMVTVTLASTGETPTAPDGALLVPYLAPAALLFFGLGLTGRSGNRLARRGFARRAGACAVALVAGILLFVAFESSPLAR